VASPGFGVRGTTIEAPKAPSGVGYGEGCPLPSQLEGLGERRGAPAAIAFSAYFRPQNASGSKKNTILLPKVKGKLVFLYENMRPCSSWYM